MKTVKHTKRPLEITGVAVILCILMLLVTAAHCNAQKVVSKDLDPFTNSVKAETDQQILARRSTTMACKYTLQSIDGIIIMHITWRELGFRAISKGNYLKLLTASGKIIEAAAMDTEMSRKIPHAMGTTTDGVYNRYLFDVNDYESLRSDTFTRGRIEFNDGYQDFTIDPKFSDTLNKTINALLHTINAKTSK